MIRENLQVLDERLESLACAIRAARRFIADVRGTERMAEAGALDLTQDGVDAAMTALSGHSAPLSEAYAAVQEVFTADVAMAVDAGAAA